MRILTLIANLCIYAAVFILGLIFGKEAQREQEDRDEYDFRPQG